MFSFKKLPLILMAAVAAFILPSTHAQAQTFCANLNKDGGFEILFGLLEDNELCVALDGLNKGTLLAPTDEAFFELPPGIFECLLIAPDQLIDLLSYHVIEEDFSSVDLLLKLESQVVLLILSRESLFQLLANLVLVSGSMMHFSRNHLINLLKMVSA